MYELLLSSRRIFTRNYFRTTRYALNRQRQRQTARYFSTSAISEKISPKITDLLEIIENPDQQKTQYALIEFFDQNKDILAIPIDGYENKYTLLHVAAKNNNAEAIKFLIENYKSHIDEINAKTKETALHIAARYHAKEGVLELIKKGANPNIKAKIDLPLPFLSENYFNTDSLFYTPLEIACMVGFIEGVKFLLGEDDKVRTIATRTQTDLSDLRKLLVCAVASQQNEILNILLNSERLKGRINSDELNYTLCFCAAIGNIEAIKILYDHGASISNYIDHKNSMHMAISNGNSELVKILIGFDNEILKTPTTNSQEQNHTEFTPLQLTNHLLNDAREKLSIAESSENMSEQSVWRQKIKQYQEISIMIKNISAEIAAHRLMPPDYSRSRIKNLVFKGGGPRGIAYIGALISLEDNFKEKNENLSQIKRVAGTSAGAITAVLLSVGYTPEEMKDILLRDDLQTFLDTGFKDSLNVIIAVS